MSLEALIKHNTAEMNKIVSVLELSLQHRNEDLAQLKHIISVRNSEINTLKGVVCSTQRRCFILQHKMVEEKKAREELEKENKDLRIVVESLRRKNRIKTDSIANEVDNSKANLVKSYTFLKEKYQERLKDLETVEEEFDNFPDNHYQYNCLKKDYKKMTDPSKKRSISFRIP